MTGLLALIILRRRRRHAVQAHGDARDAVPGSLHRHPDGESPCSWGVDLPGRVVPRDARADRQYQRS